jgi:hypothetical protein
LEWSDGEHRVVLSYAQQGNGMTIHFASAPDSLRYVKQALEEFCGWIFWAYDWCEMIFAVIGKPSVERIIKKVGFEWLTRTNDYEIYVRFK